MYIGGEIIAEQKLYYGGGQGLVWKHSNPITGTEVEANTNNEEMQKRPVRVGVGRERPLLEQSTMRLFEVNSSYGASAFQQVSGTKQKTEKPLTMEQFLTKYIDVIGALSLDLISRNNLSEGATDETIACQAWAESNLGFKQNSSKSRFKGPLHLGDAEAKFLGYTPEEHARMATDFALGYQGGTKYLGYLLKKNDGDITKALQAYRGVKTNTFYADNIKECAEKVAGGDIGGGLLDLKKP